MSIGKSSIARAVNATAVKAQNTNTESVITKLSFDKIGLLSVAQTPNDITDLKQSITKRGILTPILVAVTQKGDMWLIDGYCRYYAAKELGLCEITAAIINIENKSDANRIYNELSKLKAVVKTDNVHEEKFRVLHVKDHDLPTYLL